MLPKAGGPPRVVVVEASPIVVVLVVLLFGRGKISDLMGDVAKGIKSFKKGISENPDSSNKDTEDKNNSNSN